MKIITLSEKQTIDLGKKIAKQLTGGETIALIGELGAGKTIFTKGIASELGIKKTITSPTFVLMKIYPVKSRKAGSPMAKFNRVNPVNNQQPIINNLVHVDAYRLNSGQDLIDIGIEDYLGQKNTITIIEWANQVDSILPKNTIFVKIKVESNGKKRVISIKK